MSAPGGSDGAAAVAAGAELKWALVVGAVVAFLVGMILFTALHWSSMAQTHAEVIDPRTLNQGGEFVEDNLGTGVDEKGNVVVHVLAQQYSFRPSCLAIPAGVPVTLRATSSDVIHGFQILGTNVNTMVLPGYISTVNFSIDTERQGVIACHEFCGVGHASMWAKVHVMSLQEFETLMRTHRRVNCV